MAWSTKISGGFVPRPCHFNAPNLIYTGHTAVHDSDVNEYYYSFKAQSLPEAEYDLSSSIPKEIIAEG